MNWAWLDGKVSEKWHEEEHPEDYGAKPEKAPVTKEKNCANVALSLPLQFFLHKFECF
jgi:hypothetical protein